MSKSDSLLAFYTRNTLYCSFCGKSQHEVFVLLSGPTVFICDECVALCCEHVVNRRCDLVARTKNAAQGETGGKFNG